MSVPIVQLGDLVWAHYGKALKQEDRDATGSAAVYGSSGEVGRHRDSLTQEPTIVVGRKGSVGAITFAPNGGWVIDTAYFLERKNPDGLDLHYLFHALRNADLARDTITTSIPGLNRDDLLANTIRVPCIDEQRRIAAILEKADSLRGKRQESIRLADEFLRAVFIDMFGDPATNTRSWSVKALGDVCRKIGSGATPKGGDAAYKEEGIALIRSMNVRDGYFLWKDLARIDDEQAGRLSNVVVEADDVLINITGASVARVCRAPQSVIPARVNQHVSILRTTSELLPAFLEQLLLTTAVKSQLLKIGEAGATRQAITKAELESFKVIVPPMDAQTAFGSIRTKVANLVQKASASAEFGELLRASLGHQYFGFSG